MKSINILLIFFVITFFIASVFPAKTLTASAATITGPNLALGKPVFSSSNEVDWLGAENAVDGNDSTQWSSLYTDDQWFYVDLGEQTEIDRVVIKWQVAYAEKYQILVSDDTENWRNVLDNDGIIEGNGGRAVIDFGTTSARYVKFMGVKRGTNYGYSFYEFEVYHVEKDPLTRIIEGIKQLPAIVDGQNAIELPEVPEGYKISVYGSDRPQVIDKEGEIHTPLVEAKVNLLFQVEDLNNPENKAISRNVLVSVPGLHTQTGDLNKEPKVIPSLREWYGGVGNFTLTENSKIVINPNDAADLQVSAETTKQNIEEISGYSLDIVQGNPTIGDIFLTLDESVEKLGEEGYLFEVGDYVTIKSAHVKGAFYGTRTALQILKQDKGHRYIPKGTARDYPKYETRGMMLDVARKFYTIDFLRDYIKLLSWYKMNQFQIHLNDDIWGYPSEFRLENEKYPAITSKDGYYTKNEFRELQQLGMAYGVNIVPEIDTPGHSGAFIAYDPSLGSGNSLDLNKQETVEFVKSLFDEYLDGDNPTFIGPDVHVGMDEYHVNSQDDVEAYRGYMDTIIKHINSKGKRPHLWGALASYEGQTPISNDATMEVYYEPAGGPVQAIDKGFDILNVDDGYTYLIPNIVDYLDTQLLYNEWEPTKWRTSILPYGHPKLKGGMFAFWNDTSNATGISMHDSHIRMLPAIQTLSEKMWTGTREDKDYNGFLKAASAIGDAPNAEISHKLEVENPTGNVIEYLFEKDLKDTSGNGFDGIGKNVTIAEGKFGNGLRLGGGNSYVETPLRSLGFGWTVSMWIKPDTGNAPNAVIMESPEGQLKLSQGNSGKLGFTKENYDSTFNYQVPEGKWTHLLLTGDDQGTSLYVNGNEYVERMETGAKLQTFILPVEKIGSDTNAFKGTIDNVMIFNRKIDIVERKNIALNQPYSSSGDEVPSADKAFDGKFSTTWSSEYSDTAWLEVDLQSEKEISEVVFKWGLAYPVQYKVLVSRDGQQWTNVFRSDAVISGNPGTESIQFNPIKARYVKFQGVKRTMIIGQYWGYNIKEFEVYETSANAKWTEYKQLFEQAAGLLALGKGKEAIRNQLLESVNRFPYAVDSSAQTFREQIAALQDSINQGDLSSEVIIMPNQATFDLKIGKQADVKVYVARKNSELAAIFNGDTKLAEGNDYVYSNGIVTVKKEYLSGSKAGSTTKLTFTFTNDVSEQDLSIEIVDTTATVTNPGSGGWTGGGSSTDQKQLTLSPGAAGELSFDGEFTVIVPSGAANKELRLTITKAIATSTLIGVQKTLLSSVYEVLSNLTGELGKPATVTLSFDPSKLGKGHKASIFAYDEAKKQWIDIGGVVDGNKISVEVDRFTKLAVFAVSENGTNVPTDKPVFKDTAKHWAENAIAKGVEAGFISGYADGTFKPNAAVTRAEFAVMLARAFNLQGNGADSDFTDGAQIGKWAKQGIAQAIEAGIIKGYANGSFRPDAPISRSEMIVMVARTMNLDMNNKAATAFTDDKAIPSWAQGAVNAAVQLNLISGRGNNKFVPEGTASRAESVALLLRVLELRK
ncbi:discoidin domain-containing protein [Cohnella soli]|uniref:Discoidin domain-containing protein n=1 Tax=Cohnella soli TaxID=425005 RepID=A0ABW0HXZ5_9BACL